MFFTHVYMHIIFIHVMVWNSIWYLKKKMERKSRKMFKCCIYGLFDKILFFIHFCTYLCNHTLPWSLSFFNHAHCVIILNWFIFIFKLLFCSKFNECNFSVYRYVPSHIALSKQLILYLYVQVHVLCNINFNSSGLD